jgi:hypothetical protein
MRVLSVEVAADEVEAMIERGVGLCQVSVS